MSHLGHYGEADIGHEDPPGTFRLLCLSRDIMILFYEALHCCGLLSHLCEPQIGVYVNHTKPKMASGAERIKVGVCGKILQLYWEAAISYQEGCYPWARLGSLICLFSWDEG